MRYGLFLLALCGLDSANAKPVSSVAGEVALQPRQGTITVPILGWIGSVINKEWSGPTPLCTCPVNLAKGTDCYWYKLPGVAEICYVSGGMQVRPIEYDAMRCLTRLAREQEDTCMDVEGSRCLGGSAIGNIQKIFLGLGHPRSKVGKISQDAQDKILRFIDHIQYETKGMTFDLNQYMGVVADSDGPGWVAFRGTGANDC